MSDAWAVQGSRFVLRARIGRGRHLIGLPFLLIGAWFLAKYFLLSIAAYVRAGDWSGLFGNPIGWLVILAMGAAFLVPGWLLVFTRRVLVLDKARRQALEIQDFRVHRRVQTHALDEQREIVLLHEPVRGRQHTSWLACVYLVARDEKHLLLGICDREDEARALAEAAAAFTNLPWRAADRDAWQNR